MESLSPCFPQGRVRRQRKIFIGQRRCLVTDRGRTRSRVLIAGNKFTYPIGMGATTRVAALALGLTDNDADVRVVSLMTPFASGSGELEPPYGVSGGVKYAYACGTRRRGATFLQRRLLEAKVPVGLWLLARGFLHGDGQKALIAYTDSPLWIALIAYAAHKLGAVCAVEVCEIPFVNRSGRLRLLLLQRLQDGMAYRMVDGFIVISRFLDSYVATHTADRKPRLIVPILVACDETSAMQSDSSDLDSGPITYVGDMTHDGEVADLISSFSQIAGQFPRATLRLVGFAPDHLRRELLMMAKELRLDGRVEFAGTVDRSELPALLRDSAMLVLPRRDGLFSRAGMPTKLADYLRTGRPVVATATGDIPVYLEDGISAYLVRPGHSDEFAASMRRVLQRPDEAARVGREGRRVALEHFSRRLHGARILGFLARLQQWD
jgi:glycosyltransferase involved in cell wall biosynthesis